MVDLGIGDAFAQFTEEILNFFMFFIQSLVGLLLDLIFLIINPFIVIFGSILSVFESLYIFLASFFSFLPSGWVVVFLLMVTIVGALRIYSFAKDIQIGGFKI